jgi:hypothetical protein
MRLGTQRRIARALGLDLEVNLRGLGAEPDRVLDEGHAALLGTGKKWLDGLGWNTLPEVTYSEFGERGSIDLLAWHRPTGTLLVVEIKTELVSIEATLRKLDEKTRLAAGIAARRFEWSAKAVARLLVLPDERVERRRVAAHSAVLDGAFPLRSYAARAWCRSPSGSVAALIFVSDGRGRGAPRTSRRVARIRRRADTSAGTRAGTSAGTRAGTSAGTRADTSAGASAGTNVAVGRTTSGQGPG